ncbi:MAG: twin-arginine translocase subunit TatB [Gammaproteobacteria bacterium]|nr:twin-arginine translocase subunit TatB [Gammaproteobacteria bacterium]
MFDIGFWELMIIGLVALLVVGPERLPKLAYTAGKWLGKGRAMIGSIKTEIDREMKADELNRIVEEQKKLLDPLESVIEETEGAMNQFQENATAEDDTEKQEDPELDDASDPSLSESAK